MIRSETSAESRVRPMPARNGARDGSGMDRPLRRSWWRRHGAAATGILLVAGAAAALAWYAPANTRVLKVDGARIDISEVRMGRFEDFVPVRAQVMPLRTVYLDAVEGGRVERVLVEDGARVQPGQLLVELSNTALQLDVISREAQVTEQMNNLRTLELDLERNRLQYERDLVEIEYEIVRLGRLVERRRLQAERGNIPRADLEDARDELNYYQEKQRVTRASQQSDLRLQKAQMEQLREAGAQLRDSLEFARRNLESLKVRAPVAGRLTALNAEVGQSLEAGERIGQIDDPDGFKLTARIDEFYLGRIAIDQRAELTEDGRRYELRVSKIFPQVAEGQFETEFSFLGGPPPGVRRGQTLQARLYLADASDALLIPNGAFYQDTGGDWVFVVSGDASYAVRRTIRTGRRNPGHIEVLEGLEAGERVITSPYTNFIDMHRLELKPDETH